jgi:hypothetical protein
MRSNPRREGCTPRRVGIGIGIGAQAKAAGHDCEIRPRLPICVDGEVRPNSASGVSTGRSVAGRQRSARRAWPSPVRWNVPGRAEPPVDVAASLQAHHRANSRHVARRPASADPRRARPSPDKMKGSRPCTPGVDRGRALADVVRSRVDTSGSMGEVRTTTTRPIVTHSSAAVGAVVPMSARATPVAGRMASRPRGPKTRPRPSGMASHGCVRERRSDRRGLDSLPNRQGFGSATAP